MIVLSRIKEYFDGRILEPEDLGETPENLAVAALLIEVMVIDGKMAEDELTSIADTLRNLLNLDERDVNELIQLSQSEVSDATSLYQFTSEINKHFKLAKKMQLMTSMWRVAYADGHLDKHEENIIRRVSELIHLRHSEYIQCKQAAKELS